MAKALITKTAGLLVPPTMADMEDGQLGIITGMPGTLHQGKLVMRLASRVAELEYPYHCFATASRTDMKIEVRILPSGAELTLTQE